MDKEINEVIEGYKETEIGVLPEDWEVVRLENCLSLIRNGISKKQSNDFKSGYPVTRIETISEGRINPNKVGFIDNLTSDEVEKFKLRPGDVLFSHINSEPQIGRSVVYEGWPSILLHGMNLLLLRSNSSVVPQWLNYLFMHYRATGIFIKIAARAVNQSSINQNKLKSLFIPLPPLPEQRKIAYVLSTIQRAIELQDKIIAATRELKKSLMRHLFTYGPVPVDQIDRIPLKETEIGMVPEHWEVVRLGEAIINTQYGLSLRGSTNGKYPILRMNNLIEGSINTSDLQYVNLDLQQLERFRLNKGDILFNRTNSFELVGKASLFALEGDFVFASYLIRIITNKMRLAPGFLNYYLNWDETQHRLKLLASRGVSQSNISATKLKGFVISLPPITEQNRIAHILTAVDNKINAEEKRKSALQSLFQTMLHLLMTGSVRVKDLEVKEDALRR
ncbi:restriction endonuclease subunit S [Neomoorella carbonis]|uniref:restriction endonuclease subunit S n=1 Tax=Neomoorella carbonis TaxID=3062783 RepID=UPI0032521C57